MLHFIGMHELSLQEAILFMLQAFIAIASEDVGNADPRAMQVALAAWDCFTRVGAYEGERAIVQAIIYFGRSAEE